MPCRPFCRHGEPRRGVAIQGRSHRPLDGHVVSLLAMTVLEGIERGLHGLSRNTTYPRNQGLAARLSGASHSPSCTSPILNGRVSRAMRGR